MAGHWVVSQDIFAPGYDYIVNGEVDGQIYTKDGVLYGERGGQKQIFSSIDAAKYWVETGERLIESFNS